MVQLGNNGARLSPDADISKERNMRKTTSWIAGIMAVGVALATLAFLGAPAKADADAAEATYKAKCAMCHGPDGKGETATGKMMKVKDFASEDVQKMSDADLTAAITSGKAKMPPFKTLSADQVKDLVAFIRAFGKKK
jgi:mono/diheme cytochrome c family protein